MFNSNIMTPLTTGRLHTVKQALDLNIYETVDLKVKIMINSENKQPILQGDKTKYKMDSIVADDTGTVKLVLLEDTIDKLHIGKCYQIQNCKIRVFDNSKFLNTNEFTKKKQKLMKSLTSTWRHLNCKTTLLLVNALELT